MSDQRCLVPINCTREERFETIWTVEGALRRDNRTQCTQVIHKWEFGHEILKEKPLIHMIFRYSLCSDKAEASAAKNVYLYSYTHMQYNLCHIYCILIHVFLEFEHSKREKEINTGLY